MKFGSVFAGIGGFDLAFENAGFEPAWQIEIDNKCNEVLAHHWPDTKRYEDVARSKEWNLEPVDIICGGWPCQGHSVAGKRKGLSDNRSGLFGELYKLIRRMRPGWIVLENVPGLRASQKGEDFAFVIKALTELGYCICWRILDAQWFGVAQRRQRVFIVGYLGNGRGLVESESRQGVGRLARLYTKVLFECGSGAWDCTPSRETWPQTADTIGTSANRITGKQGGLAPILSGSQLAVASPLTTSPYADNEAQEGKLVCFQQNTRDEVRLMGGDGKIAGALAAQPGMKQQNYLAFQSKASANQSMNPSEICPSIDVGKAGGMAVWHENKQGELSIDKDGISKALRAGASHSYQGVGVRRLTPTEAERLQGFPDQWTAIDGMSDSARYKMLGNAVAVPCVQWIANRIKKVENATS